MPPRPISLPKSNQRFKKGWTCPTFKTTLYVGDNPDIIPDSPFSSLKFITSYSISMTHIYDAHGQLRQFHAENNLFRMWTRPDDRKSRSRVANRTGMKTSATCTFEIWGFWRRPYMSFLGRPKRLTGRQQGLRERRLSENIGMSEVVRWVRTVPV